MDDKMNSGNKSKITKSTVYFMIFLIINISVAIISYWLPRRMIVTKDFNYLSWNILVLINLCTWCVTLIKVDNPIYLRTCACYFIIPIFYVMYGDSTSFKPVMDVFSYFLYPFIFGLDYVASIFGLKYVSPVMNNFRIYYISQLLYIWQFFIYGLILSFFYAAFYLKHEYLQKKQKGKLLLATILFSIMVICFEKSNQEYSFYESKYLGVSITFWVVLLWLVCIFYYRKCRNVLSRIVVLWSFIFMLVILKGLEAVLFVQKSFPSATVLGDLYFVFYRLFPSAFESTSSYQSVWSWTIGGCVSLITIYAVFAYVKLRIVEKKEKSL